MSHPPMELSADLRFALELATLADAVSLPRFLAADLRIDTKADRSFVTDADIAVERTLREHIETNYPHDAFFGEESGASEQLDRQGSPARRWILDPIDGTSNFLRGVPNWATLIALEVAGEPTIGVVSAPAFDVRWFAEIGCGAWREDHGVRPRRLRVSHVRDLAEASLSFQSVSQWRDAGQLATLLDLAERVWRDRAYGDMWSYMLLAEGALDIVAEFDVKPYDLAALAPIVREAGGRFTDVGGTSTVWGGSAIASNGALHDAVLACFVDRIVTLRGETIQDGS